MVGDAPVTEETMASANLILPRFPWSQPKDCRSRYTDHHYINNSGQWDRAKSDIRPKIVIFDKVPRILGEFLVNEWVFNQIWIFFAYKIEWMGVVPTLLLLLYWCLFILSFLKKWWPKSPCVNSVLLYVRPDPVACTWCTRHFVHKVEFSHIGWNGVHITANSTNYSCCQQRKHRSSALLVLCEGNPLVDSPHKGPVMRKAITWTSSWPTYPFLPRHFFRPQRGGIQPEIWFGKTFAALTSSVSHIWSPRSDASKTLHVKTESYCVAELSPTESKSMSKGSEVCLCHIVLATCIKDYFWCFKQLGYLQHISVDATCVYAWPSAHLWCP